MRQTTILAIEIKGDSANTFLCAKIRLVFMGGQICCAKIRLVFMGGQICCAKIRLVFYGGSNLFYVCMKLCILWNF